MDATAPGPHRRGLGYYGGLDGLRALAIAAVLLYHGGVSWASGGFLGVEAFFVLSGFLITSLLVAEWQLTATIALGKFWARRARRLLPALFCLVTVIGLRQALAGPEGAVPGLEGDGVATLLYFGNWHQMATGSGYFAATGPVSPLQHTWSLAIEEQFYIIWPLLFLGVLWLARRAIRRRSGDACGPLRAMLALAALGLVASALEVGLLFHAGRGLNRVYYGTDTRAVGIFMGASLALGIAVFRARVQRARRSRRSGLLCGAAAALALLVVLVMMGSADGSSSWLFPFGFLGLDASVALLIASVVFFPTSLVSRLFSLGPLRATGQISYGIYLWHFPLFLWVDASSTGLAGTPLLLFRVTVTVIVSVISFYVIERPVRQRLLPAMLVRWLTPVAAAGALATLLMASAAALPPPGQLLAPPRSSRHFQGTNSACRVLLRDTAQYGLVPLTAKQAGGDQLRWLAAHRPEWSGSSRVTFHTCPPKKALLIGDSLAFSLGLGVMIDEQAYGIEVANAAVLGCAFTTKGEINHRGAWENPAPGCPTALRQWRSIERALHPQLVIIELGHRDEFDWRWTGHIVHLGQPAYDAYVQRQIDNYVKTLAQGGATVLFLSAPWANPPALPDGSPSPASSVTRHTIINAMLQSTARRYPHSARVVNIDKVVSPGNRFRARVNDHLCRYDGIHFTIYCAQLLRDPVLRAARAAIGS